MFSCHIHLQTPACFGTGQLLASEAERRDCAGPPPSSSSSTRSQMNCFLNQLESRLSTFQQCEEQEKMAQFGTCNIPQPPAASTLNSTRQFQDVIARSSTATTSSPLPTVEEAVRSGEAAKEAKRQEEVKTTASNERVVIFGILRNLVSSLAETFGKTVRAVVDILLDFLARTEAAVCQVVEMLQMLKVQEEEKEVEAVDVKESLFGWWSSPAQKEPEGFMERVAMWWSPPPPKEPEGLMERVAMWWSPPPQKEPEGLLDRLVAWWCAPTEEEAEGPSLLCAVGDYFSCLCAA